jgi:quinoprotein glucose dehydrogenase
VVAPTKQGFLFVFDRVSGKPLWPIEERPVPASDVPGEEAWPTQPVPTKPKPFAPQGFTEKDVADFTPEIRAAALKVLAKYRGGPLYTPPSMQGTITAPGSIGGAGWGGAMYDPESNTLFVKATNSPSLWKINRRDIPADTADDAYMADLGANLGVRVPEDADRSIPDIPITKPPYGTLTAVDLATGEFRWQVPLGDTPALRKHPALQGLSLPPLGVAGSSGGMVTRGGLIFVAGGGNTLYAIDTKDGRVRWQGDLGQVGYANPMTYRTRAGKQFVVIATGSGAGTRLQAFGLK